MEGLRGGQCLALSSVLVQPDLACVADPAPMPDENDAPEQVALHLKGLEPGHVLCRVDPAEGHSLHGRSDADGQLRNVSHSANACLVSYMRAASAIQPVPWPPLGCSDQAGFIFVAVRHALERRLG